MTEKGIKNKVKKKKSSVKTEVLKSVVFFLGESLDSVLNSDAHNGVKTCVKGKYP